MDPDELYQLMLLHDEQGARVNVPYYDLGVFKSDAAIQLAAHLGSCAAITQPPEHHEGPVTNILEAWSSPEYRCWFIPQKGSLPCCEYVDNEVVIAEEDPR